MIVLRNIDVNQIDAPLLAILHEFEDQHRIQVIIVKLAASPALNDKLSRNCRKHGSAQHAIERAESAAGFGADLYLPAGNGGVAFGTQINIIKLLGGRGEVHRLFDGIEHPVSITESCFAAATA